MIVGRGKLNVQWAFVAELVGTDELVTVQSLIVTDSDDEKLIPALSPPVGPEALKPMFPPRFHEKPLVVLELPCVVPGVEFMSWTYRRELS